MEGTSKPDYGRCVDIVTTGALKQMVLPGILAVGMPIAVGVFALSGHARPIPRSAPRCVGGLADGRAPSPASCWPLFLNNGGGAWDNAKKYIETGALRRQDAPTRTRRRSSATPSAIRSRTPPGPSLHVLIKLLGTVTLVLAPLFL